LSYDDAIAALSNDALKFVKDKSILGLGSGRAATTFVKSLAKLVKENNYKIKGIPTSLQIKLIAENLGIELVEADQINQIDCVFDGADQIDSEKYLIKGGGGALLRENILINISKKVVIMADESKFVKNFNREVPIEVHPLARRLVSNKIQKFNGKANLRMLDRGYPFFSENGNIILDCDFGTIKEPKTLSKNLKNISGIMEVGIFTRKPDLIYKAKPKGKFDVI